MRAPYRTTRPVPLQLLAEALGEPEHVTAERLRQKYGWRSRPKMIARGLYNHELWAARREGRYPHDPQVNPQEGDPEPR